MSDILPAGPSGWWRRLLSGADNLSPAIGRVLAFVVVLTVLAFLIIGLPSLAACALWLQKVAPEKWLALMTTLMAYVPAVLTALGAFATGLIALTNQTEPRPAGNGDGGDEREERAP